MYERDMRRLPPRNSRGEFRRRRRGDRGMDYASYPEMRSDGRVIRSYPTIHPQGDYRGDMNYDMRGGEMYGRDGHHYPQGQGSTYYPIQAMGTFEGYYGVPEQDYGRGYGRMRDYDDMSGRRDYGYDYGDYGETLSEQEIEHWEKKLMSQLDEREKQMFHKDTIMQKIKQMGKPMEGFGEKELCLATLMVYTDYKQTIGQNLDLAIKLAYDWLSDKDVKVRGAEKLAIYYDEIVMGGEDD